MFANLRFDINKPWSEKQILKYRNNAIIYAVLFTFLFFWFMSFADLFYYKRTELNTEVIAIYLLMAILFFIAQAISIIDKISISQKYIDIVNMIQENNRIRQYFNQVQKERELTNIEFYKLRKIYDVEKLEKNKQKLYSCLYLSRETDSKKGDV